MIGNREGREITGHKFVTDRYITVVYSKRKYRVNNCRLLETPSKNMLHKMKLIPISLKYSDLEIFGYLLNESIVDMNKKRNILIGGTSPTLMDFYSGRDITLLNRNQ